MKGYFRKRGKTWSFTIDIGRDPKTGKRIQKSRSGFKTKKEAQAVAAELHYQLTLGTYINEKNIRFSDFAEEWIKQYAKKVKVSSVRVRRHEMERLKQVIDNIPIKNVTYKMYQDAIDELSERYAYRTLKGIHTTARMIFKKALQLEVIAKDPTEFAELPPNDADDDYYFLDKHELGIFLDTAKQHDIDYCLFSTLAYSGMRIGEALALKHEDLDFQQNTIDINKTLYMPSNNRQKAILLTPKTKNSKRVIKMDPSVMKLLKRHLLHQKEWQMMYPAFKQEGFVFPHPEGGPMPQRNILRHMRKVLELAGLEKMSLHALRHTHVSLLAESGAGIKEIMERLGHGDYNTTMKVYNHVTKDLEEKTTHQFSNLMSGYHKI